MKIYKVHIWYDKECSQGYSYFSNKKDALMHLKTECPNANPEDDISEVNLIPSKKGIIKCLNIHASHPDNG